MASIEDFTAPVAPASPVKIADNPGTAGPHEDYRSVVRLMKNLTGTATVWLGSSSAVSAATVNAWPWEVADGPLRVALEPGEELWAVVATGGAAQNIRNLRVGR